MMPCLLLSGGCARVDVARPSLNCQGIQTKYGDYHILCACFLHPMRLPSSLVMGVAFELPDALMHLLLNLTQLFTAHLC